MKIRSGQIDLHPEKNILKKVNNKRIPLCCPFPVLLTHFSVIAFINEETTGCVNKEAVGGINEANINVIIALRNLPSCFFISCFTVSVAPSVNKPDFSSSYKILIISSISSFEINKVNPFLLLQLFSHLFFLQIYQIQMTLL